MRLTLVHPCIGRRAGDRSYVRSWQMEPLAPALLAGLAPSDVEVRFHDDRLEAIPFDESTDLVAISVETYTARRSYQIASEFRARGVPVVMGGFHATLCTDEVARYAEAVVVGEAEGQWEELLDDFRSGTLRRVYRRAERPSLAGTRLDRGIFAGKRYLPVTLVEASRGCRFRCDFCAVQSYFESTQTRRPTGAIIDELRSTGRLGRLVFFVDDNIASSLEETKELCRALIPLGIRWVSQASINAAHDEECLDLLRQSGCQGVLIGFESLNEEALGLMNKGFNTMAGGYERALANLRRYGIRLYATFVLGYDHDTRESIRETVAFAKHHRFYMAAFNHLTPFPGTPLHARLREEGRLLNDPWWLDPAYSYNGVPFRPAQISPEELQRACLEARADFYSLASIARRFVDRVNRSDPLMARSFPLINLMLRREVRQRNRLPLGDAAWTGELLPAEGFRHVAPRSRIVAV